MTTTTAIAHEYTLNDIEHLTRLALRLDRWHTAADGEERYSTTRFGIIEHLLTADDAPTRQELLNAGMRANDARVASEMRTHGRSTHHTGQGMPRFEAYWTLANTPSPEKIVVDHLAVTQIWPRLTPRQQAALAMLATLGDYEDAAQHLGVTPGSYRCLVSGARKRFLTWWHEGETPSRPWGTDRRVGRRNAPAVSGRKRRPATRAVVRRAGRPERTLVHGRASTYNHHRCRCTPCTRAATRTARDRDRAAGAVPRRQITVSQLNGIRARRAQGETLTAIAAALGFSDSYISRLLSGKRQPAQDPA